MNVVCDDKLFLIEGARAKSYLHGQVSQSIEDMQNGDCRYAVFLSQKGKVQCDLFVYVHKGQLYFSVKPQYQEILVDHLKRLAPLSGCQIHGCDEFQIVHHLEKPSDDSLYFENARLGQTGFDEWVSSSQNKEGALSADQIEYMRIKNGVAQMGVDVTDANLPQEARLDHALHFKKGCYLGQEVIARLHYRGHVNKLLFVFELPQAKPLLKKGDDLCVGDDVIGKITSVACQGESQVFMSYVPKKHFESSFHVQGQSVQVLKGN